MKHTRLPIAAGLFCLSLLSSCTKKDPEPTVPQYGKLQVSFANEVDGQAVGLGPMSYTNSAGNKYSVDLLKYYVTNFTLIKADGTETNYKNYNLIDASDAASQTFTLDSVLNADYTSVSFNLGVDAARNHTGAQDGALDPVNGMIWTWNTGYIFFKHEGFFKDSTGANKALVFHYGTDAALVKVTVPISKLTMAGTTRKLFLKFNLNSLYGDPRQINFDFDNNHMSSTPGELFWISDMSANFGKAFQYSKAE